MGASTRLPMTVGLELAEKTEFEISAGVPTRIRFQKNDQVQPHEVTLTGPLVLRGVLNTADAARNAIEAHFTVRLAGAYEVHVTDRQGKTLLSTSLTVVAGPLHTASCSLVDDSEVCSHPTFAASALALTTFATAVRFRSTPAQSARPRSKHATRTATPFVEVQRRVGGWCWVGGWEEELWAGGGSG